VLNTSRVLLFVDLLYSQGSVAIHLRDSGKYDTISCCNSPTVKEFLKSVSISQSYEQISSGTFLWPTV